jgi:predicted esterase
MTTTLLGLHGFTQNGALMRAGLEPLTQRLHEGLRLVCPDGPMSCSEASVERLQSRVGGERWPGPHCGWFNASDDGREYVGFEAAHTLLAGHVERARAAGERVGLLGFSQGAIATACFAALAAHGRFPRLDFAVLVAGRTPRADAIMPLLAQKVALPSLHVWGERDALARETAGPLAECFDPGTRELAVWPGPHVVPTRGDAAEAIVRFLERHAG